MKGYEERIIEFLNQATEPVDIEKIRRSCGIGNWNTSLSKCLQLLVEGKIKGQKTSRGWVFWTDREIQLEPWEEMVGTYKELAINKNKAALTLTQVKDRRITFPRDSPEARIVIQTLTGLPRGTKVALMKTDIQGRPLIVRTFNEPH